MSKIKVCDICKTPTKGFSNSYKFKKRIIKRKDNIFPSDAFFKTFKVAWDRVDICDDCLNKINGFIKDNINKDSNLFSSNWVIDSIKKKQLLRSDYIGDITRGKLTTDANIPPKKNLTKEEMIIENNMHKN